MITLTSISDAKSTGHLLVVPCPFCGENPPLATMKNGYYLVGCDNDDCHIQPQTGDTNLERAWAKWNRRVA